MASGIERFGINVSSRRRTTGQPASVWQEQLLKSEPLGQVLPWASDREVDGEQEMAQVELIVRRNGSTLVVGDVVLKDQDGKVIVPPKTPFALCRCGASKNKPFCDGSHKAINFDDGTMAEST